jgi:hypothetical protein
MIGDELSFRLLLPGEKRDISVHSRVLWTREYGAVGREFLPIPPVDLDILHDWLKRKSQVKKPLIAVSERDTTLTSGIDWSLLPCPRAAGSNDYLEAAQFRDGEFVLGYRRFPNRNFAHPVPFPGVSRALCVVTLVTLVARVPGTEPLALCPFLCLSEVRKAAYRRSPHFGTFGDLSAVS